MSYLASKNLKCNNSYQQQLNRKLKTPKFYPGATMAVTSGTLSKPEPWEGRGGKLGKKPISRNRVNQTHRELLDGRPRGQSAPKTDMTNLFLSFYRASRGHSRDSFFLSYNFLIFYTFCIKDHNMHRKNKHERNTSYGLHVYYLNTFVVLLQ